MPSIQSGLANIRKRLFFNPVLLVIIGVLISTASVVSSVSLSSLLLPGSAQAEDQDGHEDDDEHPARVKIIKGIASIHLTLNEQSQSGLVSKKLAQTDYLPEQRVYGKVMNIQGLIELRSQYQETRAKQAIAQSTFETAQHNYQRLKQLHKEAIIPAHKLQRAESTWQSEKIRMNASDTRLQSIRISAEQSWGQTLTGWALDEHSPRFQHLLSHQQVLIMISLKADQSLLADTSFIFIARDNDRQKAHKAYWVSVAPQTGTLSQGETYFFRSTREHLRIGMQIHAWMPRAGQRLSGVILPESAIIWHAGKPWVYMQTDAEHFTRQVIAEHYPHGSGYFVSQAIFHDKSIVITGGQMLLSEEFRWQIPEEDDD